MNRSSGFRPYLNLPEVYRYHVQMRRANRAGAHKTSINVTAISAHKSWTKELT